MCDKQPVDSVDRVAIILSMNTKNYKNQNSFGGGRCGTHILIMALL